MVAAFARKLLGFIDEQGVRQLKGGNDDGIQDRDSKLANNFTSTFSTDGGKVFYGTAFNSDRDTINISDP